MDNAAEQFIREYERETWSRCADSYLDTFSALTDQMLPKLIAAAGVASGTRVLDMGCGPGNSSGVLLRAGAEVTGIDFSEQMLAVAKRNNPGIRFVCADLEEIPEENDSFDTVIANYVIHHLPNPRRVIAEAARVLKPGGRFAFAVWGPPQEQSSIGCFVSAVSEHHEMAELPHGPLYGITDKETFTPMFNDAGLNNFELSKHELAWTCETQSPVISGLWTWANCDTFDQDKRDKIRAQMIKNCAVYKDGEGYSFPHSAILGCAVKG